MKKLFGAVLVAMAMFVATPGQAQSLKFGIKGGLNLTDMKIDQNSTAESLYDMGKENKNGWYIGPTLKLSTLIGIGADLSVFYDQREGKIAGEAVKQQYVYVPLNLRYNLGLGSFASFYLAAGPQFGFNVGDAHLSWKDAEGVVSGTSNQASNTFQLKKSTLSLNLGVGFCLLKHLEVGAVYNIPLGKTADVDTNVIDAAGNIKNNLGKSDVKTNAFQVSAAIYF